MLKLAQFSVQRGAFRLAEMSFLVGAGECLAVMGPSGCGKTSLLEGLCGLHLEDSSGRVFLDDREITSFLPQSRMIGFVPQDLVLFQGLTVREHLAFGPKVHRWAKDDVRARVEELARSLGLSELLDRMPGKLSGGEARRVALGRALAVRPKLLLLDEAFNGLDQEASLATQSLVRGIVKDEKIAALLVTHSSQEADFLGDRSIFVPTVSR